MTCCTKVCFFLAWCCQVSFASHDCFMRTAFSLCGKQEHTLLFPSLFLCGTVLLHVSFASHNATIVFMRTEFPLCEKFIWFPEKEPLVAHLAYLHSYRTACWVHNNPQVFRHFGYILSPVYYCYILCSFLIVIKFCYLKFNSFIW